MKYIDILKRLVKVPINLLKDFLKTHAILKVSLAVSILIVLRKIITKKRASSEQIKILEQGISAFYDKLSIKEIRNVNILPQQIVYTDLAERMYRARLPQHAHAMLEKELRNAKIHFGYTNYADNSNLFLIFLIWAIFGFLFFMFFKTDKESKMETSSKPVKSITFADVVGLQESKKSLQQVIDYMKDPQQFKSIGARMRRGIIFYGPSGTGKTTLAKATAGQAGVPFFSCNASEFCEIYVGVGPKRVKDLFARAKESAPSIIYIDQIDAIGNRKGLGPFNDGAGSQKNSTINQLLSEMDGFSSSDHILVIASTNRLEMIDSALLRAGRFDLKIKVPLPTEEERLSILKHHLMGKNHRLGDDFMRKKMRELRYWSGADLQNLANEMVYTSLRMNLKEINEEVFNVTVTKIDKQSQMN